MPNERVDGFILPEKPLVLKVHNIFLRSFKPITAFLVACIIQIEDHVVPIGLVSSVIAVWLILIIVDAYFLYDYY